VLKPFPTVRARTRGGIFPCRRGERPDAGAGGAAADLPFYLTATLVDEVAAGDAARTSSLVAALAAVPDVRGRRGRRHELPKGLLVG
jgi:hypothetical protein